MRVIKSSRESVNKKLSELCLKNGLYIRGRIAKKCFENPKDMLIIAVAFGNKQPIGWAFLYRMPYNTNTPCPCLNVYLRPHFRKKGIASQLIDLVLNDFPEEIQVDTKSWRYYRKFPEILRRVKYWHHDIERPEEFVSAEYVLENKVECHEFQVR